MKYFMFVDIKKVNLDNLNLEILKDLFPKIDITITGNVVTYKDKEKILLEEFYEDINNLKFSTLYFTGNGYNQEFIGYKFFSKDIVLILIKNSFELFSDFSFYEIDEKLDYMDIINNYIFNKIDLNKYNITGYKNYIYFYINALIIKNKNELNDNGIIIKIIDDKIDDFLNNYINQKKSIKNYDNFIFIYCLLFKGHSAVLVDIDEIFFLFDSSHYYEEKMNKIFKNLKEKTIIINLYIIQNLGVCSYYSINFINIIIEYLIKNREEVKKDNTILLEYTNSKEFITILVNKLNEFFRNNEKLILINDKKTIMDKEFYKYIKLSENLLLNKNIYKMIFIDLIKLFDFLKYDNKKDLYLIFEENKLYLKVLETKYLYEKLLDILSIKIKKNNEKYMKTATKKIFDYKIRNKMLDSNLSEKYFKKIFDDKIFVYINKSKIFKIKKILKEELIEDINDDLLNSLKNVITQNITSLDRIISELIKKTIIQNIKEQLISNIFKEEKDYYTKALEKILTKQNEFMKEQKNIIEFLDKINNNYHDSKNNKINEVNEYIKKMDEEKIILYKEIDEFD